MDEVSVIGIDRAGGVRISFAQNGEDVRLWRAFKDQLSAGEPGFYVEVGGWDPVEHSITRSFYGKGWSGIVFEPVPAHAQRFQAMRPRDRVEAVLAGSQNGEQVMHMFAGTGLSTTDHGHARRHREAGFVEEALTLPVRRVSDVLEAAGVTEIHFMTIDVEGAEAEVIAGMDWTRFRPWVLVIESTLPLTTQQSHGTWDTQVRDAGYNFVTFDGLNRFYVAQEHGDLAEAIAVPPNVLDDYITAGVQQLWDERDNANRATEAALIERDQANRAALAMEIALTAKLELSQELLRNARRAAREDRSALEAQRAQSDAQYALLSQHAAGVEEQLRAREADLAGVVASRSWRVTKPMRALRGRS